MRSILFVLLSLIGGEALATVSIVDVSGASVFTLQTTQATQKIYGGSAGPLSACDQISNSTCDTCANTPAGVACNKKRIHPGLYLTISIRSDTAGRVVLADNVSSTIYFQGNTIGAGSTGSISILWSDLCLRIQAYTSQPTNTSVGSNCEFNGSTIFKIGVDSPPSTGGVPDGTINDSTTVDIRLQAFVGPQVDALTHLDTLTSCDATITGYPVCAFKVLKGDEKAIVDAAEVAVSKALSTGYWGIPYKYMRLYFTTGSDFNQLFATRPDSVDLELVADSAGGDPQLSNDVIPDLTNGQQYVFTAATVDEAGNVGAYMPVSMLNANHTVIPEAVSGLLTQDFQCFVATATFGTPDAKEVVTLRKFRNYMLKNYQSFSEPLVHAYYKNSPPLARFIEDRPWAKAISRALLFLPIQFAKLTLRLGVGWTTFIFLALLSLPFVTTFTFKKWRRRST